ncbi:MAG: hypothetical protein U5O39_17565 [Gammaproteobacteria bacterium]|nr:hypothetical protein [Gammaproteobacteria bacterium]
MADFVVIVKEACETCQTIVPALRRLAASASVEILCQDNPAFPRNVDVVDDSTLERSWHLGIEIVPTLIRASDNERTEGWVRSEWEALTGLSFEADLPAFRPGCGSS